MMDIILIIGLPGSGKTTLANELKYDGTVIIDDISNRSQLPSPCSRLIITDVNFCNSNILKQAFNILWQHYPEAYIRLIYFENDSDKCRRNVKHRNDGRDVEGTIRRFEKIYEVPAEYAAREIWQPS